MLALLLLLSLIGLASADCSTTCATSAEYCGVSRAWIAECDYACAANATLATCAECLRDVSDTPGGIAECIRCYNRAEHTETCNVFQTCNEEYGAALCKLNGEFVIFVVMAVVAGVLFVGMLAAYLMGAHKRERHPHLSFHVPTPTKRRSRRRSRRTPGEGVSD